jgi:hypothetical protein
MMELIISEIYVNLMLIFKILIVIVNHLKIEHIYVFNTTIIFYISISIVYNREIMIIIHLMFIFVI